MMQRSANRVASGDEAESEDREQNEHREQLRRSRIGALIARGRYDDAERSAQWMLDLRPGNIPALTRAAYLRELFGDILKVGAVACLSPFALGWAARKAPVAWWATALVFAAGIALSNAPAAWIAFACVLLLELLHKFNWRRAVGVLALALVGIGLVWAMAIHAPDRAATTRVQATLDAALASSRTSICQMRTHPINGVGTGALPSESSDCAADALAVSDADRNGVPLLLELPAQTGVIGLLLWLAGVALAWRAWRYADATARMRAWPALQALLAMLFPLNAGLPVYGGLWGSAILMMAGLYAGALWGRIETEPVRQS